MRTHLSIEKDQFLINGKPVYSEIAHCPNHLIGRLMNARFIQGIFHDQADEQRFHRFGKTFDADNNTNQLIAALPQWYQAGLRAFTVGMQGGGTCFTIPNSSINSSPFSADGTQIDSAALDRLTRLINAADEQGMIVILSMFYCGQTRYLNGTSAIIAAIHTLCAFLREKGWKNIILEIANEFDLQAFSSIPAIQTPSGMVALMDIARHASGLPVGCSGAGGSLHREVVENSDVILFHGNGQSPQTMAALIDQIRLWAPDRPIICNEDSPSLPNMRVCMEKGVSWGYYNNMTKQEPPTDWRILPGEDEFFAWRMAHALGIERPRPQAEIILAGAAEEESAQGQYWLRVASLYPEKIAYVDFYHENEWQYRCFEAPFSLYYLSNWQQKPTTNPGLWRAEAVLHSGEKLVLEKKIGL